MDTGVDQIKIGLGCYKCFVLKSWPKPLEKTASWKKSGQTGGGRLEGVVFWGWFPAMSHCYTPIVYFKVENQWKIVVWYFSTQKLRFASYLIWSPPQLVVVAQLAFVTWVGPWWGPCCRPSVFQRPPWVFPSNFRCSIGVFTYTYPA